MRRTTIFRSELSAFGALWVITAGAAAQQPPAIQRPIQQAQRAANQTSATQNPQVEQPAQPTGRRTVELGTPGQMQPIQGQGPATHTVQQGETLWSLAQQYLGDPMLWPEIYRLNTTVIEDPHWIYPGEELRLTPEEPTVAPADTTVVVQQPVVVTPDTTPLPPSMVNTATGPTIFDRARTQTRVGNSIEVSTQRAYRAVRAGEYFSSGFLTENQPLNAGRLVSASTDPSQTKAGREVAQLYERVIMSPPASGVSLDPGDLVLTFRRTEEVGDFGQIIIPTGLIRVTGPASRGNNLMSGEVVRVYGPIEDEQELIEVQPFVNNSNRRSVEVSDGVEGRVIRMREQRGAAQMQDVFYVDKGANDGVRPGDILELYEMRTDPERGASVRQLQGRALVVNTRARTATAVIIALFRPEVGSQSQVRQISRMPS